jgi:hypothetical protein
MVRRWADLGQPELTPDVVERLSSASEQRFSDLSYEQHTARRDRLQLAVLSARDEAEQDGQA